MQIEKGDKVTADYEGKLDNGEIFDSSSHGDHSHPLEFEVGSGKVMKGFDDAVMGMKEGEEKDFSLDPKEAYGERKEELQREIPRDQLPKEHEPKEGMMLMMGSPDGQQFPVRIAKVSDDIVTLDLNHPLAGKRLTFKITITKIEKAKKE